MDATWPAVRIHRTGPWAVREGRGGGNRVSAATADGPWSEADIALAEATQAALGQPALFLVRAGEERLDAALAARGYGLVAPVTLLARALTDEDVAPPPLAAFALWPPLAIQREIWAAGGIGAARQAVMDRAAGPKAAILARTADRPAGVAFAAVHERTLMVHAVYVLPDFRRMGSAGHLMRAAAAWGRDAGCTTMSLAVERTNAAALSLYASQGLGIVGQYHYRLKTSPPEA